MARAPAKRPILPRRIFNRLSEQSKTVLESRSQPTGPASIATDTTRSVSVFLEQTIRNYECEIAYIKAARDGLVEAQDLKRITADEFRTEIVPFLQQAQETQQRLSLVKHQKELIEEDLEDAISIKRQKQSGGPSLELLENAYTQSILPRVMAASARQRKSRFDQSGFRKAVQTFYDVPLNKGYCHVLGCWLPKEYMKAAHLVPKSLTCGEISYLYSSQSDPTTREDPRNGKSI